MKSKGHRRHHASRCHSPKETTKEAERGDRPCDRPLLSLEARPGFEPRIKALQASALATWPSRPMKQAELVRPFFQMERATGVRTRDLHLGKVARYQLRQARERTDTIRDPVARCKHDFEKAWLSWSTGGRSADDGSPGCLATISCCVQPLPLLRPAPVLLQPSYSDRKSVV